MDNKAKFKDNLKLIEIEIFSFCNRKCWFCPNSYVDRISETTFMHEDVYLDLIGQLQEIDYSGELTYSRYNEPLAYREVFTRRVKQAREMLPKATLRTNTNGDYITSDYIEELCDIGLDQIWIQQYLANEERYEHSKVKEKMLKKLKKIGLPYKTLVEIDGCKIEYDLSHKNTTIHLRARNFSLDGSSRGGIVPIAEDYTRTQRCLQPFHNMYIDYNGHVMVCCALRSDVEPYDEGRMGHINQGKLWDIHASDTYKPWREHHKEDGPKEGVCKTCRDNVKPAYLEE